MMKITETGEQQAVIEWCELSKGKYSELDLIFHIPNEGKRSNAKGAELKSIGLKSGVSDLCLPVARGGYHALYIEMKKNAKCRPTKHQKEWIVKLNEQNNLAVICYSFNDAIETLQKYLNLKPEVAIYDTKRN